MFPKFNQRFEPGFNTEIPNTIRQIQAQESFFYSLKENFRTWRRFFTLLFLGQSSLERSLIPKNCQKILWLNPSSSSIGDSLMELSGRKLLAPNYEIHLLTASKNYALYQEDNIFSRVCQNPVPLDHPDELEHPAELDRDYDLILIDIYNSKSLKIKSKYFKDTPFCAVQGYFYGADFNRMLFSYHRINALLDYPFTQTEIDRQACHYLHLKLAQPKPGNMQIMLAIGGEDELRTYHHWSLVIQALLAIFPLASIYLLGSTNGETESAKLNQEFAGKLQNQVAQLSLLASARLLAAGDLFIGADGGLMHIAEAYNLPGIALFAKFRPELRLGYNTRLRAIYSDFAVDETPPAQIISELKIIAQSFKGAN